MLNITKTSIAIVALATVIFCSSHAEARNTGRFQLGAGIQLAATSHDLCTHHLDVHECRSGTFGLGPQLFGNYRFARRASVGVVGSFWRILNHSDDVANGVADGHNRLVIWRTAAELRLYPLRGKRLEWWVAFELGVAGASDAYIEDALLDARRIHQLGFTTGAGTGIDIYVTKRFLLGAEFRGVFLLFGDTPKNTEEVIATEMGAALWPTLGIVNFSVLI